MKLGKPSANKVMVKVIGCHSAQPGEKNAKGKPIKAGRLVYTTEETFDVLEATAEQVAAVVRKGLEAASK